MCLRATPTACDSHEWRQHPEKINFGSLLAACCWICADAADAYAAVATDSSFLCASATSSFDRW
jgi:hypothetical protein